MLGGKGPCDSPTQESGTNTVVGHVAVSWHRQTPSHPGLCQQGQPVSKQAGTVSPRGDLMSVSSPGRDLFTYSGGWHELGNLSCQIVSGSRASLLRERTMGWAVPLLSLGSCAHLGRLLHLSVPDLEPRERYHGRGPEKSHLATSYLFSCLIENWSLRRVTKCLPQPLIPRAG